MDTKILLVDLPAEIIDTIIAFLDQAASAALVRCCSGLRSAVEARLYTDVLLCVDWERDAYFLASIKRRPQLAAYVRSIAFNYFFRHDVDLGDHYLSQDVLVPRILSMLHRLQHFEVSMQGDEDNSSIPRNDLSLDRFQQHKDWEQVMRQAHFGGLDILASLKSCAWNFCPRNTRSDFGYRNGLFLHPFLTALTLSNAEFYSSLAGIFNEAKVHFTSLQTLRLLKCDTGVDFFRKILSFPRALRELEFIDDWYSRQNFGWERGDSIDAYFEALVSQRNSLETLTLQSGMEGDLARSDLSQFKNIKTLKVSLRFLLPGPYGGDFTNVQPHGFPPNLEHLTLLYSTPSSSICSGLNIDALIPARNKWLLGVASHKQDILPHLKSLVLNENRVAKSIEELECWRRSTPDFAKFFRTVGVSLVHNRSVQRAPGYQSSANVRES